MTRGNAFLTVFLMFFVAPAFGQIIIPPTVVWVGPEDECDFTSIQEWLDQPPCPFCAPPLGGLQLRLSDSYQHSGNFEINSSVSIIGGFPSCGAASNGTRKQLQSTASGALIVLGGPAGNPIRVTLGGLDLVGSNLQSVIGGVLELEGGVELELQNTRVIGGIADQGGGVGMHGYNNRFTMSFDSSISGNLAFQDGGGIWCQDNGVIDFQEGAISNNSAATRGGGIGLDNCTLKGAALNKTRRIAGNRVRRDADPANPNEAGKGGGIYARGANARVELGGILTRTRIENNQVDRATDSESGDATVVFLSSIRGGGLHAQQDARVILRNVEFIGNEAPHGGGLSFQSGARVDIDRTSGPCLAGRASECSAFIGNKASMVNGTRRCENGHGAAIYGSGGRASRVSRTTFRDNESFKPGSCISFVVDFHDGSLIEVLDTSGALILEQNLVFLNAIKDFDDNYYFRLSSSAGIRFLQNTVAFNNDAGALLRFATNSPFEAVGNILWDPEVGKMSSEERPAALSACNVLEKNLPAAVNQSNTEDDPGFVDFSTADFHLAPGSPAINLCSNMNDRLSPTFDIEGRARPSSDGGNPLLGNYDSGAFEFHSQPPDEVDLALTLTETGDPNEAGAVFEAVVGNVGLTTAQNVKVRFDLPPGGYQVTGGNWSCDDGASEAVCTANLPSGLAVPGAVPLIVEVNPDPADGTCVMDMRTDPADQPDTVPDNDARTLTVPDCDVDGVVPDEIFDDRFEQ